MKNSLGIHIKYILRNSSKEVPPGLIGLGKLGVLLSSATAEIIAFIGIISFTVGFSIVIAVEEKMYSISFGINPFAVIIAMIFGFLYIDSYSESFQTKFNKTYLNVYPLSIIKRYYLFYIIDLLSLKILYLIPLSVVLIIYNIYSPFINFRQTINLYVSIFLFYLIYNNLIMILKLLWVTESKIKSYLLMYSIFPIIFCLTWKSEELFNTIENHFLSSMLIVGSILVVVNYICFLIFKQIMQSGYLLK